VEQCDSHDLDAKSEYGSRARWLASTSVLLAVLFEVFPVEADFSYGHLFGFPTSICTILTTKLIFVSILLTPLLIYVAFNGYSGLRYVRGRVVAVCLIIALRFILDLFAIISILRGAII
jgi:hypothetical protein